MKAESIRWERGRLAPFPFTSMFQNGPRRQGCAPENLFKPGKDSPPPRTNRAPLPAAGRSEDFPMRRERGQMQRPKHQIRPPPIDDVNNLWHHHKCQRALASTVIQIRRNALFTSPEYAPGPNTSPPQWTVSLCPMGVFLVLTRSTGLTAWWHVSRV